MLIDIETGKVVSVTPKTLKLHLGRQYAIVPQYKGVNKRVNHTGVVNKYVNLTETMGISKTPKLVEDFKKIYGNKFYTKWNRFVDDVVVNYELTKEYVRERVEGVTFPDIGYVGIDLLDIRVKSGGETKRVYIQIKIKDEYRNVFI